MSEKPQKPAVIHSNAGRESRPEFQKRLVRWNEYAENLGRKGILCSFAGAFGVGGWVCLIAGTIFALSSFVSAAMNMIHRDVDGALGILGNAVGWIALAGFGLAGLWMSKMLLDENRHIEPVALLTKSTAKHLPEADTLVRGADRPMPDQQTELLRAAGSCTQTPPEQLLRATVRQ